MATFRFQAKDKEGKSISGVIEAAEMRGAAAQLREQGLFPSKIEPVRGTQSNNGNGASSTIGLFPNAVPLSSPTLNGTSTAPTPFPAQSLPQPMPNANTISDIPGLNFNSGPTASTQAYTTEPIKKDIAPFLASAPMTELALMYRQMATLLDSGVPMVQALSALVAQTSNGRLKAILEECVRAVSGGYPLSAVMERHPSVFTTIQVELIRAGETSGLLSLMCNRIAGYLERDIEMRRKINRETIYPKIVFFVAGCVLLLLTGLKAGVGSVVEKLQFGVVVAIIGFGIFWFYRYAGQYPAVATILDRIKLLIPGAGAVAQRYATARFARALASLYGGGVMLPRAVDVAARVSGNAAITQTVLAAAPALMQGEGVSSVLARSGLLSPIAVQMARTGEQTGNLDDMMDKVADYLEQEADVKAHRQALITGAFALLCAGAIVLYVAVSFYMGQIGNVLNQTGE